MDIQSYTQRARGVIKTAQTEADVKLALIARNNDVLAEAETDAQGHGRRNLARHRNARPQQISE